MVKIKKLHKNTRLIETFFIMLNTDIYTPH